MANIVAADRSYTKDIVTINFMGSLTTPGPTGITAPGNKDLSPIFDNVTIKFNNNIVNRTAPKDILSSTKDALGAGGDLDTGINFGLGASIIVGADWTAEYNGNVDLDDGLFVIELSYLLGRIPLYIARKVAGSVVMKYSGLGMITSADLTITEGQLVKQKFSLASYGGLSLVRV